MTVSRDFPRADAELISSESFDKVICNSQRARGHWFVAGGRPVAERPAFCAYPDHHNVAMLIVCHVLLPNLGQGCVPHPSLASFAHVRAGGIIHKG